MQHSQQTITQADFAQDALDARQTMPEWNTQERKGEQPTACSDPDRAGNVDDRTTFSQSDPVRRTDTAGVEIAEILKSARGKGKFPTDRPDVPASLLRTGTNRHMTGSSGSVDVKRVSR